MPAPRPGPGHDRGGGTGRSGPQEAALGAGAGAMCWVSPAGARGARGRGGGPSVTPERWSRLLAAGPMASSSLGRGSATEGGPSAACTPTRLTTRRWDQAACAPMPPPQGGCPARQAPVKWGLGGTSPQRCAQVCAQRPLTRASQSGCPPKAGGGEGGPGRAGEHGIRPQPAGPGWDRQGLGLREQYPQDCTGAATGAMARRRG